ncbi:MAG: TonB family protein, partial [Mucilaginibacter sp.]
WLDLVFSNRNKTYGAYELRQTYASTMLKSMGITFLGVGAAVAAITILAKPVVETVVPQTKEYVVNILDDKVVVPPKVVTPPAKTEPTHSSAMAAEKVKTTAIPTHVVAAEQPTDPPINDKIDGAVGPANTDGPNKGDNANPGDGTDPKGTSIVSTPGNGIESTIDFNAVEVLPEPVGGKEAWSKFLQKHLRYPAAAEDRGLNGRVFLSFIIEKDGRLTDIKVERGAGFGFDEEALRVLKMAPAWKPGIQNGRPVRVKYTIPINFRAPE